MNTISAVVASIIAAVQQDHGSGYDLSGADNVQRGTFSEPPTTPFVSVGAARLTEAIEHPSSEWTDETYEITLQLWSAATGTDASDRLDTAEQMRGLVQAALDIERNTPGTGLFRCVRYAAAASDPDDEIDVAPDAFATSVLTLNLSIRRATGTGA